MYKKYWSLLAIVMVAAMILSACATPSTPVATTAPTTVATTAPATIHIWAQWSGDYLTAIQAVFQQYMTDHPNITIVIDSPQDVASSLQVAIPAGEGPDIIAWANDSIGKYAINGYIVDLGTLGVTLDWLKSNYEPAAVNGVQWQSKIWAIPESQEAIALVYNTATAQASDFPSDPMDFTGLLDKAKTWAEAHPGKFLVCNQGLGGSDAYHEAPVYFGFGVPSYVDDTGKAYMNTPEALNAGNWIKQFSQYSPKEATQEICEAGIADGTFAAMWTGPWEIANFEKAGISYAILPMGKPFVGIKTLMVTKNAVDRGTAETALDIIKYYTNTQNEVQVALANKTIPANTAALKDSQIQALATIKGFGASANLGIPMASTPYADAQWGPVGDATLAIWNGTQTPEQALAAAQKAIEDKIATMK